MRREIVDFVTAHPGCASREIRAITDKPASAAATLTMLVTTGILVKSGVVRQYRYWAPAPALVTTTTPQVAPIQLALTAQRREVLAYLAVNPGATGPEVQRALGRTGSYQVLQMMVAGGLIIRSGTPRYYRYTLPPVADVLDDVA